MPQGNQDAPQQVDNTAEYATDQCSEWALKCDQQDTAFISRSCPKDQHSLKMEAGQEVADSCGNDPGTSTAKHAQVADKIQEITTPVTQEKPPQDAEPKIQAGFLHLQADDDDDLATDGAISKSLKLGIPASPARTFEDILDIDHANARQYQDSGEAALEDFTNAKTKQATKQSQVVDKKQEVTTPVTQEKPPQDAEPKIQAGFLQADEDNDLATDGAISKSLKFGIPASPATTFEDILDIDHANAQQCQGYRGAALDNFTNAKVSTLPEDELQRLRYENMGGAMAWGYFFYLRDTAIDKLKYRIRVYEDDKDVEIDIHKLIILIPLYCSYEPSEEVIIEHAQNLIEVVDDVAGTVDRKYHLSVYKMREGKEKIYFIPETAQCLETLDIMCKEHKRTELTKPVQELIRNQFVEVLEYLLHRDESCRGKYELLNIEGTDAGLAKEICLLRTKKNERKPCPNATNYHWNYNHFGIGLANWFYFNYLRRILAELPDLIKEWEARHKFKLYPKLIILVPKTCWTEGALDENDDDIEKVTALNDIVQNCGTTIGRTYSITAYKVKMVEKSHIQHCTPQYATPIRQLYKMTQFSNHCIDPAVKSEIRNDFVGEMQNLLSADVQHSSICEVVYFDNDAKKVSAVLKDLLVAGSCTPPPSC